MDVPGLCRHADHHRRRGQHRADAGGQGRTSSRTRSTSRTRCASRRCAWRSCRRWRRSIPKVPSTIEAGGAVQDGRSRPDHRRASSTARSRSTTRSASKSVKIKKIDSPVAGRANVLVVPDLEAGNMLAKSLSFLAGADAAGIVLGARGPDHPDEPRRLGDRRGSPPARHCGAGRAARAREARQQGRRPEERCDGRRDRRTERGLVELQVLAVRRERARHSRSSSRGQAEGLYTSPRFVAQGRGWRDPRRKVVG